MLRRSLILVLGLILAASGCRKESLPLYKNPDAPVGRRVEDLLRRMTLEEKLAQLQNRFVDSESDIPALMEGLSWGTAFTLNSDIATCRRLMDELQHYACDSTRLGIPVLPCSEGIQGLLLGGSTIFPHALAQGSTFDPDLIKRMAGGCADEARAAGIRQVLSPVLDIARDPRWGRVEETYGEDPFLIGEMATAFVQGYQERGVACTPKHFVAHGSPTGGLNCSSVSGGERELRNLYLPPFEKVISKARPLSIMSSYNSYDGVPVSGSRYYLTDILRGELGFDGYCYADWGAVHRLENYHFAAGDTREAARMAITAGVDFDCFGAFSTLREQVEEGLLDEKYIDEAVRRVLSVKFRLGLFEHPFSGEEPSPARSTGQMALAREIADESAILLENNGILPIDTRRYRTIALLGPNSDQTVFGDYAWPDAFVREGISLLEGLREALPAGTKLLHAEGCDWWSRDDSHIAEAVALARRSDLAIVAVGSRSTFLTRKSLYNTSGEGNDLSSLDLPGRQMDLLKAVKATGKPLVVVLISGKPFAMPWIKDNADAFLVQWYAGEEQGAALADILLGNTNPSGRLNISFPRSTGNIPCFYNYYPTDREYYGGHGGSPEQPRERYVFEPPTAVWSFGEGMSYSAFSWDGHRLDRGEFESEGDTIRVSVTVRNTSGREGKEVVQLYVRDLVSSVASPVQQLKAFSKIAVPAHGSVTTELKVPVEELALVDASLRRRVEPGQFEIQLGQASNCIVFRDTIVVK